MPSRPLYRSLLRLHPPAFRRQFAEEMLWIFDETVPQGVLPLFADGIASLARQWILRSGMWKVAVAAIGGCIPILMGVSMLLDWPR